MTDDLVVAIHNALERNQNIEGAMQSLLNAGYSQEEVQQAANQAQLMMQQEKQLQIPLMPTPQISTEISKPKKKKTLLLIIALSIIAIAIVTFLIIKII